MRFSHKMATGGLMVGGFAVGFAAIQLLAVPAPNAPVASRARPQAGTEVLAIFVGSSTCGASRFPGLLDAVHEIRAQISADANQEGKQFVSVGVALDQNPTVGIKFLEEFGPFDEISSGGSWVNNSALAYVIRDFPALRAMPQLILIEREIELDETGLSSVRDRLVGRKVGTSEIIGFADEIRSARTQVVQGT